MRPMLWDRGFAPLDSGSARGGPELPYAHDDVVYPDDLAEASDPWRVDVTITERGPQPSAIQVHAREAPVRGDAREHARAAGLC
jgi:hypothetical protein